MKEQHVAGFASGSPQQAKLFHHRRQVEGRVSIRVSGCKVPCAFPTTILSDLHFPQSKLNLVTK